MRILCPLLLGLAMLALPAATTAQTAGSVELAGDVKVQRTELVDGVEQVVLREATEVLPGDHLMFTTTYRNATGAPVDDFVITNPLPEAVQLAADGNFEVSVDGGVRFAPLTSLTLSDAGVLRAAGPHDVTHIRWVLPHLAANAGGIVTYSAIVR